MSQLIASSKSIIVVGLGVTGLSVARYLQKKGLPFVVADSRDNPPMLKQLRQEFPSVRVALGPFANDDFVHAGQLVLSPGISRKEPAIARAIAAGAEVVGDIELFARELATRSTKPPVVAVTGSNGKTTVTSLVAAMAEAAGIRVRAGGNLGTPALELLRDDVELYVLEVSSFQLESTDNLQADAATVLNLSADHMDRYANLALYHLAKQRVYFGAKAVVTNRQDPLTAPPIVDTVKRISFGLNEPDLKDYGVRREDDGDYLARGLQNLLPVTSLALQGRHNVANALAALALGEQVGIAQQTMLDTLQTFQGLPHRCQQIAEKNGVRYINDSKATNVGATVAAIEGLVSSNRKNIILIAGGDGKGADFSTLKPALAKAVRVLVVIGRDAEQIAALAPADISLHRANDLAEAVQISKDAAVEGDLVLLSPACASFDMFENYEDRGRQFTACVESLEP